MRGYVAAFLLTLAVEPPLYAVALRRLGVPALRGYRWGLYVNGTSHPLTWLVLFPALPAGGAVATLVVVEVFAVAWEAAILRVLLRRDLPLLVAISLVVNAISLGLSAIALR